MTRVKRLTISGYRSIKGPIKIELPLGVPVVLVGENNAGKSNILRALDLVLGEFWPGSRQPEDHEFWKRDPSNQISIQVEFEGLVNNEGTAIQRFEWTFDKRNNREQQPVFRAVQGNTRPYVRNEWRDECVCITVGAERQLSYQLSYSSKWTMLSKLMNKFHQHLTQDNDRVTRLKNLYEATESIFNEVEEFKAFRQELHQQFSALIGNMSYWLEVDFSAYDPSRYFHALRVVPREGNDRRTIEELGTGQEQILALSFAYAYAKAFHGGIVLIIEEPEAHLHPLAQQWLAGKLHEMAREGLQIILTTHSPHFVNLLGLEGLVLVRKDQDGATYVVQKTRSVLATYCQKTGAPKADARNILEFYSASASQEILEGVFAKKVILVEGQSEQLALPIYMQKLGLDFSKEGIAILPVIGKNNIPKWWRLFTAYDIPTYVIFDADCQEDKDISEDAGNKDILTTLQENPGIVSGELARAKAFVGEKCMVFKSNFEETLRSTFPSYSSHEQNMRPTIGTAKPILAREVAKKICEHGGKSAEGWSILNQLKEKICNLGTNTGSLS